ncbi:hypothetical protein BZA05DRAFT_98384 [Tricharina praecox]|uniref:uncharacterized protein n=1 Tax=Tricharina praecox TaxID=43433 RepID=UPI00222129BF|nr:uncharacterized protein BZA05DRAFT_98384 [Tricharina praecox]KAI5857519.1 hypothetical protein BZA05DRAFT_98384 [Tricharina praecox]
MRLCVCTGVMHTWLGANGVCDESPAWHRERRRPETLGHFYCCAGRLVLCPVFGCSVTRALPVVQISQSTLTSAGPGRCWVLMLVLVPTGADSPCLHSTTTTTTSASPSPFSFWHSSSSFLRSTITTTVFARTQDSCFPSISLPPPDQTHFAPCYRLDWRESNFGTYIPSGIVVHDSAHDRVFLIHSLQRPPPVQL